MIKNHIFFAMIVILTLSFPFFATGRSGQYNEKSMIAGIPSLFDTKNNLVTTAQSSVGSHKVDTKLLDRSVDVRDYGSITNAVKLIGSESKLLRITVPQTVDTVTIPSNIMLDVDPGALITVNNKLTINGSFKSGLYQVFTVTGKVFFGPGSVETVFPEWWGGKGDAGITDNTAAINAALTTGKTVTFTAARGSYYKITSGIIATVAGTSLISHNRSEIRQVSAAGFRGAFIDPPSANYGLSITASDVTVDGLTITGPQNAAQAPNENGIYAAGENKDKFISNIVIKNCIINSWGMTGIKLRFVDNSVVENNIVNNIFYMGIVGCSTINSKISKNNVTNITGGILSAPSTYLAYGIVFTSATSNMSTDPFSTDIQISDNHVSNIPNWEGIDVHYGTRIVISGNDVKKCRLGINLASIAGTNSVSDVIVRRNTILADGVKNQYRGIGGGGISDKNMSRNIIVSDNIIDGYGLTDGATNSNEGAMMWQHIDGLTITGNVIRNSHKSGICLNHNIKNMTMTGNSIIRIMNDGLNPRAGILVIDSIDGLISGNTINTGSFACVDGYGHGNQSLHFGPNTFNSSAVNGPIRAKSTDLGRGLELYRH